MGRTKTLPDGKNANRQFLVQLDAELIRKIKILAIDRDVTASSLVKDALLAFLAAAGSPSAVYATGDQP